MTLTDTATVATIRSLDDHQVGTLKQMPVALDE